MCLGVPGKILSLEPNAIGMMMGKVSFGGVAKEVCLAYVPEVKVGDYVIVHVGFALSKVDEVTVKVVTPEVFAPFVEFAIAASIVYTALENIVGVDIGGAAGDAEAAAALVQDGMVVGLGTGSTAYFAIETLIRYLAVELAPHGIVCNAVSPGVVETEALDFFPSKDAMLKHGLERTPAGRLVTPEDVAKLVAWLCTDDARMIVGKRSISFLVSLLKK